MIIGIDGNEANVCNRVGIGEYAFQIITHLSFTKRRELFFVIYLKNAPLHDLPKETKNWQYRVIGPKPLWTQLALPFELFLHKKVDLFFSPSHYAPRFSPVPSAISIMDLSYVHFPELFKKTDLCQLKNWTSYSVKQASRVFTISHSTKDDIIKTYNIDERKIVVTYPGFIQKKTKKFNMRTIKSFGIQKEYILFVGTLQPRKNITRLIEAFSKVLQEGKKLQLVIVGKKGWLYSEILQAPSRYNVKDSVVFLDFVKDEDLPILYQQAICYVLPSLYEGFGFPVLEAMQNDCPVIVSDVSSLPEVGGDACLYIDPEDVDDIASKIKILVNDRDQRRELIAKGRKQLAKFSWEKTARETLNALETLVKG